MTQTVSDPSVLWHILTTALEVHLAGQNMIESYHGQSVVAVTQTMALIYIEVS